MSRYSGFPEYVPVAQKKKNNEAQLEKLKKQQSNLQPVSIKGTKLASNWWGIAWNKNLESYSDYANRLPRGRSYVRHGAVLDLQITKGRILALVSGSGRKPYEIEIKIEPMSKPAWDKLITACEGKIDSLGELVEGKFPKALGTIFTDKQNGLFPTPKEIKLACSCPDWASMCKHVAAVLYGIGVRLDENPELFFTLRSIDIAQFIESTAIDMAEAMIKKANKGSARIIQDEDMGDLFDL